MKIYLDFDGTVVEHRYPDMGPYNQGAFEVIMKLQQAGHEVILNTYRADCADGTLEKALDYLNRQELYKITPIVNWCAKKLPPGQWNFDVFRQRNELFIDDICAGIPLMPTKGLSGGSMVDWAAVDRQLEEQGFYQPVRTDAA